MVLSPRQGLYAGELVEEDLRTTSSCHDRELVQVEASRQRIAESSGGRSGQELRAAALKLLRGANLTGAVGDFGAGEGDLLRCLLGTNRFSLIAGFDLRDRPADLPLQIQWRRSDLNAAIDWASNSFDLVTSLGLIEYLENPYAFAREIYRVLRPEGTALLTTPNNESWRALLSLVIRGNFAAFPWLGENVNLTALVRRDFDRILQFAGFGDLRYSYNHWGMVPRFAVSWQTISGGLLRGMRYSDDLLVMCRKV
jgi:2-polyprenyl-3-methyl-5-hydroxy-6-metoxy-1,4-benzoquinol methylase